MEWMIREMIAVYQNDSSGLLLWAAKLEILADDHSARLPFIGEQREDLHKHFLMKSETLMPLSIPFGWK